MFCKDDRCELWVDNFPPIEIGGYKMLDVFSALKNRKMTCVKFET